MNDQATGHDDWVPCPPGELERIGKRVRGIERRRVLKQLAGAAAAVAAVGLSGYLVGRGLWQPGALDSDVIACEEVMRRLQDYQQGRLDAEWTRMVARHLDTCPHCGAAYRRMLAGSTHSA
jgi:hypothetical protein